MQANNDSTTDEFTRCLGIYHLLARPTGTTFVTYISVIVILSIFSILSAVGNGLIIYVYLKQKSLQRTNTFLLVCLAFLDFVSAVLLEPLYVVRLLSEIFGFTSCVYILIVRRLLEYLRPVSFMTLALITIERYLALFKAIAHRRMVTKQRLLHVVLLIWFVWFLVICIRSIFPKITSAFYTFFTSVAFSLLAGNFCMYFKIGKLARLHSRPTRVSTAPGSLSVGYTNPRSINPGSTSQASGVVYSKTEESINYVGKAKQRNSRKIAVYPKSTRNNEQSCDDTVRLNESGVFSTQGELSHALGDELYGNKQKNNSKENDSQPFDNTTNKTTESNHKTEESNCKNETYNNKSNSVAKVRQKATNIERVAKVENSRQHKKTEVIIITKNHKLKGMEKTTTTDANANQTQNLKSVITFENTEQEKDVSEEDRQLENATPTAKTTNFIQDKNTEATSSANTVPSKTDKTNKDAPQTTTRLSLKNSAKLAVETRERNATWTVFYIVAILTLCYLPIATLLVYLSFQDMPDATSLFIYVPIADTIALFNALVNPFIYCLKNRKMRAAVKGVLQRT